MNSVDVFSSKARIYAKYRWRYAPQAIQTIFDQTKITKDSCVADIGAGTGILTREFVGKVGQVFAIEPNPEMRAIAIKDLGSFPTCQVIGGRAEATTLQDHAVDLVIAGQSVHWFEPKTARQEFYRILRPRGWLAFCRNYGTDLELGEALKEVYLHEGNTYQRMVGKHNPAIFYYKEGDYLQMEFPFKSHLRWDEFVGALSTASYAPDVDSALYKQFERRSRRVFDDFNDGGYIEVNGKTELYLGQIVG